MKPFFMANIFYKKHLIILFVLCFCVISILSAQTGAEIEDLLKTPEVTYAQAARFVLKASEAAAITDSRAAFNFAAERKWLPKDASSDTKVRMDGISLLFMRAFNFKGGLFFSIFKNQHYAYRELEAYNAFKGKRDPQMAVSGDQLLFITSRILSIKEGE